MYGVWTYCPKCALEIAAPDSQHLARAVRDHECAGYPAHEQLHQRQQRARRILWADADWRGSIADVEFCHQMFGSDVPFSGDHRPSPGSTRQSAWEDLLATTNQKVGVSDG